MNEFGIVSLKFELELERLTSGVWPRTRELEIWYENLIADIPNWCFFFGSPPFRINWGLLPTHSVKLGIKLRLCAGIKNWHFYTLPFYRREGCLSWSVPFSHNIVGPSTKVSLLILHKETWTGDKKIYHLEVWVVKATTRSIRSCLPHARPNWSTSSIINHQRQRSHVAQVFGSPEFSKW